MSNILIFLDMSSKRVHFYSEIEIHIKDLTKQKAKSRIDGLISIILITSHILEVRDTPKADRNLFTPTE
jgi:hypothetical protein